MKKPWLFQLILFSILFFIFGIAIRNAHHNLQVQGIRGGFDFLDQRSGFSIIQTLIPYNESETYGRAFWVAFLNTVFVSGLSIFFATLLGLCVGIGRKSHHHLLKMVCQAYVEILRNVPLLLQLFLWYFVALRALPSPRESWSFGSWIFLNSRGLYLPKPTDMIFMITFVLSFFIGCGSLGLFFLNSQHEFQKKTIRLCSLSFLIGVVSLLLCSYELPVLQGFNFTQGLALIPEFVALFCALSLYTSAFIAEIIRSGINSVSKGQWEAAYSLGLSQGKTLRLIIIPQALRVVIPPLTSQYLNLTKNSSLAAAIGYPDLVAVFAGTVLNQTGQAIEVIGITMGVYLFMSLSLSFFMNWFNRHYAL